jgi:CAAX protease family protein
MQPLRSLGLYLVVVLLGGALLAPFLYVAARWGSGYWNVLSELADAPFHRYVHRATLGLAFLGLWPLLKSLGMRSWAEVGLTKPGRHWKNLGGGLALGFLSLAGVAGMGLAARVRFFRTDATFGELSGEIVSAILAAATVAFLEELLFRGVVFGGLRKAHHWLTALTVSSALYAWVHFFRTPENPGRVDWTSGFVILGEMLRGLADLNTLLPGIFVLGLAGAILAICYQRTGNLYCSIGLHAGWVFWLKSYSAITSGNAQVPAGGNGTFWGSRNLYDGWLALIMMVLVLAGVLFWGGRQNRVHE